MTESNEEDLHIGQWLGGCHSTRFGCCPDGITYSEGHDNDCGGLRSGGCRSTRYGCCPDGLTYK